METINGLNIHGPAIVGTGIAFTVLAVAAVALRFASKRIVHATYGVDDWLLLVSLSIFFATEVLVIRSDIIGAQAQSTLDDRYVTYLKYVYIYSIFSFPIIALTQASILFLYRRIFYPSHLRYTSMVLLAIVVAWLISALVIEIGFPGFSIDYFFPGSPHTDWNVTYLSFWLAMAIIETVVDIVLLVLPLRELHRLQLTTKKKCGLSLIFALGGFVIITSIVRMSIIYRPDEPDFDLTQGDIWLNVHLGTAIISACLPTYRPLLARSSRVFASFRSGKGSDNSDDTQTLRFGEAIALSSRSRYKPDEIYMGSDQGRKGHVVGVSRSESDESAWKGDGPIKAGQAIGVKKTVEVV